MNLCASDYVVLDVETNGLSSLRDDLLSISVYQPDTQKLYNRFLPLELNSDVYTTDINGITKKDLKGAKPLTQEEVDALITDYELQHRTILTYGSLDERFIRNYFKRKGLQGFDKLRFFNFKRNIISSRFSGGNITKDNLCRLYGIDNVQALHTGANDCILEWELFKKLDGNKLLITYDKVFELNPTYIVPASYLATFPNFKYHTQNLPHFRCSSKVIKSFDILSGKIRKFPTNFNGMVIEHLINQMLDAEKVDSSAFLIQNKSKLKYLGKLPSAFEEVPMYFNPDGTVTAVEHRDEQLADDLNSFILLLKKEIAPLVEYIRTTIFQRQHILSQELVVHRDKNVLALCDLSSSTAVLEIKTFQVLDLDKLADQLFYESNGRNCYFLQIVWSAKRMRFVISKIGFEIDDSTPTSALERRIENFKNKLTNKKVDVVTYTDSASNVTLRCQICGNTFSKSYNAMLAKSDCPHCAPPPPPPERKKKKAVGPSPEEQQARRTQKYLDKLHAISGGRITALCYSGAKDNLTAHCNACGKEWTVRADHLLARTHCPRCKIGK